MEFSVHSSVPWEDRLQTIKSSFNHFMPKQIIPPKWHEVLSQVIPLVTRVLLYGPPDTGKTTTATLLSEKSYRLQCSRQQGIEDLLGSFVLRNNATGQPVTEFVPGPIPRAMREGCTLVVDEFDQRNASHDSIYHALLDDPQIACIALPDGSECRPVAGFRVVCTTNQQPSAFPPAIQRRFELKLWCGTAHPDALATLPDECASLLKNWQLTVKIPEYVPEMGLSSLRVYARLAAKLGQDLAAMLVFAGGNAEFLSSLASNQTVKSAK
jgi:nitric oxide reductase NorQ protein